MIPGPLMNHPLRGVVRAEGHKLSGMDAIPSERGYCALRSDKQRGEVSTSPKRPRDGSSSY